MFLFGDNLEVLIEITILTGKFSFEMILLVDIFFIEKNHTVASFFSSVSRLQAFFAFNVKLFFEDFTRDWSFDDGWKQISESRSQIFSCSLSRENFDFWNTSAKS